MPNAANREPLRLVRLDKALLQATGGSRVVALDGATSLLRRSSAVPSHCPLASRYFRRHASSSVACAIANKSLFIGLSTQHAQ